MSLFLSLPEGDYVVALPTFVILTRSLTLPHTVVAVAHNRTLFSVPTFSTSTQALLQRISVAELSPMEYCTISAVAPVATPATIPSTTVPTTECMGEIVSPDLRPSQVAAFRVVLASYLDISDVDNCHLGRTHAVNYSIETGDASPLHRRPYRVSYSECQVIQKEVEEMLATKYVIQSSSRPRASPVVPVKNKDYRRRCCIDYRHLNQITKKDIIRFYELIMHSTVSFVPNISHGSASGLDTGKFLPMTATARIPH